MRAYEPTAATAVVGVACFQLWQAWNNNAPSLADARAAAAGDVSIRQRLVDADLLVGGLAVIVGVALAVMMRDMTALLIMLIVFGCLSTWHHAVLAADSR